MKLALTLAALAVVLVGCGPRGKLPEEIVLEQEKKKEEKGPDQTVQLKGGKLERSNPEQTNKWSLAWSEAEANFNLDEAKFGGRLKEVSGTIIEGGAEASSFVAREGEVKPGSTKFTLNKGIKLSSKSYDASLECNQLSYDAHSGILVASNGIRLNVNGNVFPSIESLSGKADLTELAPNPKALNEMKKNPLAKLIVLTALTGVGSNVIAQDEENRVYRIESEGKPKLSLKTLPNGQTRVTYSSDTAPIVATLYEQGLVVSAKTITFLLGKDRGLLTANMTGGIKVTSKKGSDTIVVSAPSADYTDSDQKLIVNGAIVMDRNSADGSKLHAEGNTGTIILDRAAKGDKMIKSATIGGRIVFRMTGMRSNEGEEKKSSFFVNASAGRLVYNEAERKITMSDNVQLSGNDPSLVTSMSNVESIVITLTEDRQIDTVELEGSPGKTVFEQKKTTGGGGGGKKRK